MKLLYFTKYSEIGASSRLRSLQFFPYLRNKGYDITWKPLFNDLYVKRLYSKKSNLSLRVRSYFNRIFSILYLLLNKNKYDLIIIEKELLPYFPPIFEFLLYKRGIRYILDYDDPIFHNYDLHKLKIVRRILGRKIDKIMGWSSHVFAGNSYLEDRARRAGAKSHSFLPTVIDLNRYNLENYFPENEFVVGWIGSPSTIRYLEDLFPVFKSIHSKYPNFRLNIIGAREQYTQEDFIRYIPWDKMNEVEEINKFSIGVMPLHDTPFEKGKCSYKLIQYMGCGKAVIGSSIGSNNQVITNDWNGFLVKTDEDWKNAIEKYLQHPELIRIHGESGRKRILEIYNIDENIRKMTKIFQSLND